MNHANYCRWGQDNYGDNARTSGTTYFPFCTLTGLMEVLARDTEKGSWWKGFYKEIWSFLGRAFFNGTQRVIQLRSLVFGQFVNRLDQQTDRGGYRTVGKFNSSLLRWVLGQVCFNFSDDYTSTGRRGISYISSLANPRRLHGIVYKI